MHGLFYSSQVQGKIPENSFRIIVHERTNKTRIHENLHGMNLIVNARRDERTDIVFPIRVVNKHVLKNLAIFYNS